MNKYNVMTLISEHNDCFRSVSSWMGFPWLHGCKRQKHSTAISLNFIPPSYGKMEVVQTQVQVNAMNVVLLLQNLKNLKTLSLINSDHIKDFKLTCSPFATEGDIIFIILYSKLCSVSDEDIIFLFQGYLLYKCS